MNPPRMDQRIALLTQYIPAFTETNYTLLYELRLFRDFYLTVFLHYVYMYMPGLAKATNDGALAMG